MAELTEVPPPLAGASVRTARDAPSSREPDLVSGVYVAELWRYPVKSMRGEPLERAEVALDGIRGDRLVHAEGRRGLITARTHPGLLGLAARLGPGDEALVEGRSWRDAQVAARVRAAAGPDAHLVAGDGPERYDILPLLVATDGAIAAFGRDGRRLRPNIVLGGVEGLTERSWEQKILVVGDAIVLLHSLRARCIMTTYDPDSLERDIDVLRDINHRFDGTLALNAAILRPGTVAVGDPAEVVDLDAGQADLLAEAGLLGRWPT